MKYTQVKKDAYESIQVNAGILLGDFNPEDGSYKEEDIIGATSGGSQFNSNTEYVDFGEDIDNAPNNTMQLKRVQSSDPTLSTTFIAVDTKLGRMMTAAAEIDKNDQTHIIPTTNLSVEHFNSIWLVGDYSDKTGKTNGGFIAIHIKNALNTGGFQWQTGKNEKGQFSAEFHGHYDINNIDDQPFEIYIKAGEDEPEDS